MFLFQKKKTEMVSAAEALPGRPGAIPTAARHFVFDRPLSGAVPEGMEEAMFGMGCFWGVERIFWKLPGVWMTRAGYAAGHTPNPTYEEVCSGRTGHNEVVHVIFDPKVIGYADLLKVFWEGHDPTQGMRQRPARPPPPIRPRGPRPPPPRATPSRPGSAARATAPSRPRSCPRPPSSMPRTTTSSILPRIRGAIAGSAARA